MSEISGGKIHRKRRFLG